MAKRSYNGLFNQVLEKVMEYPGHVYFVTLTLKDDSGLNKDTISNFLNRLKYRDVKVDGYLWVKELQKRGVVHYHMLILVPGMVQDFYDRVNKSWGYGWVFVKGLDGEKGLRNSILYIMKYIKKDVKVKHDKMRRKIGRGGVLKFRAESFLERVVKYSEFEYVGGGSTKGMRVKIYRGLGMVMFVASGVNGVSIHLVEWHSEIEKIIDKLKYEEKVGNKIASLLNNIGFLTLSKVEQEDVLGYHRFDRAVNRLLWELKIS